MKTIETAGRTYIPQVAGWETVVAHLAVAPSVSLALGIGRRHRRRARVDVALLADRARHRADDDRRSRAGGLGETRRRVEGRTRREPHPHAQRRHRRRSGERSRSIRASRALPVVSADERRRIAADRRHQRRSLSGAKSSCSTSCRSDPRKVYKMRPIIEAVVDRDSFFEIGRAWGKSIITGSRPARRRAGCAVCGRPVRLRRRVDGRRCRKLTRLIDLSAIFHLPLVHLVDCPGFLIGKQSEEDSTIRFGSTDARGARTIARAVRRACVVRKAFGVAGAANHKPGSHHVRVAWPSGDWGSLPIEGGIEVAYKAELAESPDPDAHLAAIKARLNRLRSPFRSAEYFEIEEIIDPRDTRAVLTRWVQLARRRLATRRRCVRLPAVALFLVTPFAGDHRWPPAVVCAATSNTVSMVLSR